MNKSKYIKQGDKVKVYRRDAPGCIAIYLGHKYISDDKTYYFVLELYNEIFYCRAIEIRFDYVLDYPCRLGINADTLTRDKIYDIELPPVAFYDMPHETLAGFLTSGTSGASWAR